MTIGHKEVRFCAALRHLLRNLLEISVRFLPMHGTPEGETCLNHEHRQQLPRLAMPLVILNRMHYHGQGNRGVSKSFRFFLLKKKEEEQ